MSNELLASAELPSAELPSAELPSAELLRGEVLVLDDSPEDFKNLRTILLHEGYDITFFNRSEDASCSEQLQSQHLVLISLDLKKEDPLEAYEKLSTYYPDSKFAFVSDHFEAEKIEVLLSRGIQAFFTKPLSYQEFMKWAGESTADSSKATQKSGKDTEIGVA